ncbi:MAG: hypothetical protein QNJ98_08550 [Planctomycetota bacterium]|nr:hypothetical protein [Planctomycetota bacterium]
MVGRNIQREFDVLYPAFSAALAETIAWCTRADRPTAPYEALWSAELGTVAAPEGSFDPEHRVHRGVWTDAEEADPTWGVKRVRRVAAARRQLLAEHRIAIPEADANLHDGRLLAYEPALSTAHEVSAIESRGFFDLDDGPGWDAWVMGFGSGPHRRGGADFLLLSWVPRTLQRTAAEGVLVNPEGCVWWPPRSADAKACLMSILAGTAG